MKLTQINVYPIKSLGGISLASAFVEKRGLKYDRRWMLINSNNDFMTQRQYPQMALLQTSFESDLLKVHHKNETIGPIKIPLNHLSENEIEVPIWDDFCMSSNLKQRNR